MATETITLQTSGGGTVSVSYDSSYGTVQHSLNGSSFHEFYAQPKNLCKFSGWTLDAQYSGDSGYWYNEPLEPGHSGSITRKSGTKLSRYFVVTNDVTGNIDNTASFGPLPKITYVSNGGSSVDPFYGEGQITLASAPTRSGYSFNGWEINGETYGSGASYNLQTDVVATAQWLATNPITTSPALPQGAPSQAPSIDVDPSLASYVEGMVVTVTAAASGTGIAFSSWTVDGVSSGVADDNVYTFTMPSNPVTLTANYELAHVAVTHGIAYDSENAVLEGADTIAEGPGGKPLENAVYGDVFKFTAPIGGEVKNGCEFFGWYVNGSLSEEKSNVLTLTLNSTAVYVEAVYATVVTIEKDETDGQGTFDVGEVHYANENSVKITMPLGYLFEFTAIPDPGYYFAGWRENGDMTTLPKKVGPIIIQSVGMTFTAVFVSEPVKVDVVVESVAASGATGTIGTLAVTGDKVEDGPSTYSVEAFTQIQLVATRSSAQNSEPLLRIARIVTIGGEEKETLSVSESPWLRDVANEDLRFRAIWGAGNQPSTVTVSTPDANAGSVYIGDNRSAVEVQTKPDSLVTVTAVPTNGHRFVSWAEGGTVVSSKARYTFQTTTDRTLVAAFEEDPVAICIWEGASENKRIEWSSGVFTLPRPFDPVAARVDATGYPVALSVGTMSSPDAEPTRTHSISVSGQGGRRLQRMRPERFMKVSVESVHEVDAVVVATNMTEAN